MNFSNYITLFSIIILSGCNQHRSAVIDAYSGRKAVRKYCYSCHAPLVKLDGPSFKEISLKNKSIIDSVLTEQFGSQSLRDTTKVHSKVNMNKKELEAVKFYILNFKNPAAVDK